MQGCELSLSLELRLIIRDTKPYCQANGLGMSFYSFPTVFLIFLCFPRTEHWSQLVAIKSVFMLKDFLCYQVHLERKQELSSLPFSKAFHTFLLIKSPSLLSGLVCLHYYQWFPNLLASKTSSKNVIGHESLSPTPTLHGVCFPLCLLLNQSLRKHCA